MNKRGGGFTIIETMLVLAITGAIGVGLFIGWSANVSTQSYKDGVNTLLAKLQTQYDDTYNMSNSRGKKITCGAAVVYDDTATTSNQGSSNCVVLGRYILFAHDKVTIKRIVGVDSASASQSSDLQSIKDFSPQVVADAAEIPDEYDLPWGITLYKPDDSAKPPVYKAMVIIRSPLSGAVYTYSLDTTSGVEPTVASVLNGANSQQTVLCLMPGTSVAGTPMAITIAKDASTHESVSRLSQEGGNKCK
jgi:type II secretory pathway pseudopilin PulG